MLDCAGGTRCDQHSSSRILFAGPGLENPKRIYAVHTYGRSAGRHAERDAHERLSPGWLADGRTTQARSVFAYWFVGKDRVTPYHWQRIYWTAKDRIFYNTNHRWAYILIHIPIKGDAEEGASVKSQDDAMKVVDRFIQAIYPALVAK